MRILFLAQYITWDGNPAFMRNRTGYGYMVKDIAEAVGVLEHVDLLTMSGFTTKTQYGHIHLLTKTKWGTLFHIKGRYLIEWMRFTRRYSFSFKRKLQLFTYYASLGYVDHVVKKGKYDLVHIHGVGGITAGYEAVCQRYHVPCVFTLHGLNSFEDGIIMEPEEQKHEKDFLEVALVQKKALIFISTGIKNQVVKFLKSNLVRSFFVVTNGTSIDKCIINENIRSVYGIKDTDFLFVYVGNISTRKNQIQVARAFQLLPELLRSRLKILFVGNENDKELSEFITRNQLSDRLICTGNIPKKEIHNFYLAANATIMSSLSEGFGLSIIEGFVYGKPNVAFADLAAIPDLYDKNAMVLVHERTDAALARGIEEVVVRAWDEEWIAGYAKKFSLESMARRYVEVYKEVVNCEN